jgi:lysophospholipase L1-like esterase
MLGGVGPRFLPLRSAACVALLAALGVGCGTGRGGPATSIEPLPTGLVGPVAPTVGPEALRYVALGDTYTFGDGVRQVDRWPNQLVRILRPHLDLDLIANLAGRSTASRDVIEDQLPDLRELGPQFVTIQVGANDVCLYDEDTPAAYTDNIRQILGTVLTLVGPKRVIVLTAPDFTLTPEAVGSCRGDADQQSARIRDLNAILREVTDERGVAMVDVSSVSDRVTQDGSLLGPDGSHPSAKQYAGWADLVAETIHRLFREADGSPAPASAPGGTPLAAAGRHAPSLEARQVRTWA